MISHKYKCIFVEVPKTGSTSMRRVIGQPPKVHNNIIQMRDDMETYWTHYGGSVNRFLQSMYLFLPKVKRKEIGRRQFDSYFKFGFVRNPWDRTVSLYERKEGVKLPEDMTFEQFVDWINYSSSTCTLPVPHRYQLDWFTDASGNVLVDFIGRFENLQDDWAYIAKKLRIDKPLPHKRLNPKKKHYTEYYTDKTKEIIAEKFKVDIEYFDYKFGG
jgi:hypothetical protein